MSNHPRTRRQFDADKKAELRAEYPYTEGSSNYHAAIRMTVANYADAWWAEVEAHGKARGIYRAQFLTGLKPGQRRALAKWYPDSIPAGYVFPECR